MVNRIDWRSAKEPLELIHRAADELWAGRLVVLPTDTHYVAAALSTRADAVSRLVRAWGVGTAPEFVLAPTSPSDLPRFVKQPSTVARRLADRCWPGPVTLVFPAERAGPIFSEIHDSARKAVSDDFGFHLRLPHHKALEEILRLVPAPLVLGGVGGEGKSPSTAFGPALDEVAAVFDDGPPKFSQPPTVARINGSSIEVKSAGVVSPGRLQRLANEMILFVCTGNTCRSPMAEGLLKKYLAEALECEPEALPERGFTIVSAGVRPISGAPASEGARAVMRAYGVDLDDHAAQAVSPQLAQAADRILVMTREHQELMAGLWPATAARIQRLGGDRDVVDPFGGSAADYEAAANQIAASMRALAADLKTRAAAAG